MAGRGEQGLRRLLEVAAAVNGRAVVQGAQHFCERLLDLILVQVVVTAPNEMIGSSTCALPPTLLLRSLPLALCPFARAASNILNQGWSTEFINASSKVGSATDALSTKLQALQVGTL